MDKERVRQWMRQRMLERTPLPSLEQIRAQVMGGAMERREVVASGSNVRLLPRRALA